MGIFSRIGVALGLTATTRSASPPMGGKSAMPDLSLWQQFQRIGGSLSPERLSGIIREADSGRMSSLMDLANEARQKDCHLQSVLATNEECIAGLPWEIFVDDDATATEKKAAKWIEQVLRSNASFNRMIAHHAGAVYYGYAVTEISWGKDADSGRLVPVQFQDKAHRRFRYRLSDGAFVWDDTEVGGTSTEVDFITKFPRRFVVSRPRVTGDVPCREGLVRVLMWASLFRNWTMSDWLRTGEIAWKPWRVGSYDKADYTSKEDIDNLTSVLEGMSANGVAVVPNTTKIDVAWAPGATTKNTHSELFAVTAQEMSKAVLGQTETTQSSQSSGYSQAKVHNEVRKDLRESRARAIAFDFTRDVVIPMLELNFGPKVRRVSFRFVTEDKADLANFAKAVKDLYDAGARIPHKWIWDQAGIPQPEDGDECLGDDVDIPIDPKTGLPAEPNAPPPNTPPTEATPADAAAVQEAA